VLHERWETASRTRITGCGFKPPEAASAQWPRWWAFRQKAGL